VVLSKHFNQQIRDRLKSRILTTEQINLDI